MLFVLHSGMVFLFFFFKKEGGCVFFFPEPILFFDTPLPSASHLSPFLSALAACVCVFVCDVMS